MKEAPRVGQDRAGTPVFVVQMDMGTQEEKERRVNLDFPAILVHKGKMVTPGAEERRGREESEGDGAIPAFLDLPGLQVTEAHQEKRVSRVPKVC